MKLTRSFDSRGLAEKLKMHSGALLAISAVVLAVLIVYWNDLSILAAESVQNEAYSYVLFLPFFAAFLFYRKKDLVKATSDLQRTQKNSMAKYISLLSGAILCLIAFIFYWYGSNTFYPLEYHIMSLPVFLAGVTLLFLNPAALRMLIVPIVFLLFLVPLPATILYTIGGSMANVNTQVAYGILKAVNLPITMSYINGAPTILLTTAAGKASSFTVDIPCSGIYSLIAFAMLGVFFALVASGSVVKRSVLFFSGFLVFAVLNLFRVVGIITLGYFFGEQLALTVHSFAGFLLIFVGMLFILVFSERLLKVSIVAKPRLASPCSNCAGSKGWVGSFCKRCGRFLNRPSKGFSKKILAVAGLLVICCSAAVVIVQAQTFVTANGQFKLASNLQDQSSTDLFPQIQGYNLSLLKRDTEFEKVSGQDYSFIYRYVPENGSSDTIFAFISIASTMGKLHNAEFCLSTFEIMQGQDPLVHVLDTGDVQLLAGGGLNGQFFAYDDPRSDQMVREVMLYWYEKATFNTGLQLEQKYVRISLIVLAPLQPDGSSSLSVSAGEEELLAASIPIATMWEPIRSQSFISLGVTAQQELLVVLVAVLVAAAFAQYLDTQRRIGNNTKIFNNYATKKERIVLEVLQELFKNQRNLTTNEIIIAILKARNKPINPLRVVAILKSLERNAFIKRAVISTGNVPFQVWKTQLASSETAPSI